MRFPQSFADRLHGALATLADVLDGLGRDDDAAKVRRHIAAISEY